MKNTIRDWLFMSALALTSACSDNLSESVELNSESVSCEINKLLERNTNYIMLDWKLYILSEHSSWKQGILHINYRSTIESLLTDINELYAECMNKKVGRYDYIPDTYEFYRDVYTNDRNETCFKEKWRWDMHFSTAWYFFHREIGSYEMDDPICITKDQSTKLWL